MTNVYSDLELAHHMATVATRIAMSGYRNGTAHRSKDDGSPVSDADLEVETALVEMLARERPADGILAEEFGGRPGTSGRRWLIDPIDGTQAFLQSGRAWGTHIALTDRRGALLVALFTRPTEDQRWWAQLGHGTYSGPERDPYAAPKRLRFAPAAHADKARVGGFIPPSESAAAAAVARHAQWCEDEVSVIGALLDGRLDAVLDEGGNPWDQAPGALLVMEAGGVYTDPYGGRRLDLAWCLYGTRPGHAALWPVLAEARAKETGHAAAAR